MKHTTKNIPLLLFGALHWDDFHLHEASSDVLSLITVYSLYFFWVCPRFLYIFWSMKIYIYWKKIYIPLIIWLFLSRFTTKDRMPQFAGIHRWRLTFGKCDFSCYKSFWSMHIVSRNWGQNQQSKVLVQQNIQPS